MFCGGLGTRGSQGFNCCGSPEETAAFKAVIDWLNGRCRAFTNLTDNIEIRADWCTGKVAMSGKSYLGTMCIAVASTGVEGLETIIPEAAISNWYDYYRCNGVCRRRRVVIFTAHIDWIEYKGSSRIGSDGALIR